LAIRYPLSLLPLTLGLVTDGLSLEFVVWFAPSLIGGAVAVSIVGVLLGPFYPIAMNHAGRIIPHSLLTGSIGWIAGFGQAGSAILPFITGAMASRVGIQSLQPLCVLHPNHTPITVFHYLTK
jgi:fucose permease